MKSEKEIKKELERMKGLLGFAKSGNLKNMVNEYDARVRTLMWVLKN